MRRKEYSKQFREQACRLVREEGYTPAKAAKSLGMPESTLVYWLRPRGPADQPAANKEHPTARGDAAAADPKAMAIQIRELQAQVRRLEMEKEILKKATAFFANQQP
jgi:transposase